MNGVAIATKIKAKQFNANSIIFSGNSIIISKMISHQDFIINAPKNVQQ